MQEELDPDLRVREELISIHALNPFTPHSSSPRGLMMSSHVSQLAVIEHGEPQIIQSGVSDQLAEHTFRVEVERDARVICMLKRYSNMLSVHDDNVAEHLIIVQYRDNLELDAISVPRYHKLHYKFGFKYKLNEDVFVPNIQNMTIPAGTVIADSPAVNKEGDYCFGIPANTLYAHVPEVTGDGVIISRSLAEKLQYRTYEHIVIEFGEETFPLNLYGDDDVYKPYPDIGDAVRTDRVVAATREYDNLLSPILLSKKAVKEYSTQFDKPFYSRSAGGTVVDVKVYKNDKARKSTYTETIEQVDRYAAALKQHYQAILKVYEEREHAHMTQFRKSVPVTERFHRKLIDAYAMTETTKNVKFLHKNDRVDLYRVEITIEHVHKAELRGPKITTLSGTKGVIVGVLEDEDMMCDTNGIRADIVMDPTSVPGRMNPSNLYEQSFGGVSRRIKKLVSEAIDNLGGIDKLSSDQVTQVFHIVTDGLAHFDTEQYYGYMEADVTQKYDVLKEIYYKECYIYYRVSSSRKPPEILASIKGTIYEHHRVKYYTSPDSNGARKLSVSEVKIMPQYIILLSKTPEDYLATASPKTNHFDLPVSVGPKIRQNTPYKNSPVRILSETETRLYRNYCGAEAIAELKDRANSIDTHKLMYKNILEAAQPTNIDCLVDRKKHPFGTDKSLELLDSILNVAGIDLTYVKGK